MAYLIRGYYNFKCSIKKYVVIVFNIIILENVYCLRLTNMITHISIVYLRSING